jgi:hypothetical protein
MLDADTVDTIIHFVDQTASKYTIPYKNGNTILIGNYAIRCSDEKYLIFECKTNKIIDRTFSRAAAIAIAKNLDNGVDVKKIHHLDSILQKNYLDSVFYKNIIKKTQDHRIRAIREARLQNSLEKTQMAYNSLEHFVLSNRGLL